MGVKIKSGLKKKIEVKKIGCKKILLNMGQTRCGERHMPTNDLYLFLRKLPLSSCLALLLRRPKITLRKRIQNWGKKKTQKMLKKNKWGQKKEPQKN